MNFNVPVTLTDDYLIELLLENNNQENLLKFIIALEKGSEDWDMTEKLLKYSLKEMVKFYSTADDPEDLEYKQKFISLLKKAIKDIEKE